MILLLLLLLFLFGCGQPAGHGTEPHVPASADVDEASTEESTVEEAVDWQERRRQDEQERSDSDQIRVAVFQARFRSAGLPDEPTEAVPLSKIDAPFILVVEVSSLTQGTLPDGWTFPLCFAIHSPALYFARQGLSLPEGSDVPQGEFVFEVWTDSEGWFHLAVFAKK